MQLAYSSKGLIENQPMSDYSNANITKNKAKRARRLFLLYSPSKASLIWSKKPFFFGLTFKSPAAANSFKAAF